MIVPRVNASKHGRDLLNFSVFQCRTEEDIAPGLRVWRRALSEARSAAQVALCIQQLQKSIAWEKSIMKVVSGLMFFFLMPVTKLFFAVSFFPT